MSASTITVWTCDRCGAEMGMSEREQPPRWHRLTATKPPLGDPNEQDQRNVRHDVHLCGDCTDALHHWLYPPEQADEVAQ